MESLLLIYFLIWLVYWLMFSYRDLQEFRSFSYYEKIGLVLRNAVIALGWPPYLIAGLVVWVIERLIDTP